MVDADIQRLRNTNATAIVSNAVSLNSSTSTKVADANSERIYFCFTNSSNKDVWLKLQPAATDDDKKGIFVPAEEKWLMPEDNDYTGEISAIAESGTPDVYYTEY